MTAVPTAAELAAQLDDLGWTLTMRCERHVWHVWLTTASGAAVEVQDLDWLTAITQALAAAHRQLAQHGYAHG